MRMLRQSRRHHSILALLAHRSVSWAVLTSWRSRKCTSRWPSLPCRELAGAALRGPSGTLIKRTICVLAAGLGIGGLARIADMHKRLGRVVIRGPNGRSAATATLISRVTMGIRAAPRMRLFEKPAARYIDYTLQLFLLRVRESGIGRRPLRQLGCVEPSGVGFIAILATGLSSSGARHIAGIHSACRRSDFRYFPSPVDDRTATAHLSCLTLTGLTVGLTDPRAFRPLSKYVGDRCLSPRRSRAVPVR